MCLFVVSSRFVCLLSFQGLFVIFAVVFHTFCLLHISSLHLLCLHDQSLSLLHLSSLHLSLLHLNCW